MQYQTPKRLISLSDAPSTCSILYHSGEKQNGMWWQTDASSGNPAGAAIHALHRV
jgi:hypothetical protein